MCSEHVLIQDWGNEPEVQSTSALPWSSVGYLPQFLKSDCKMVINIITEDVRQQTAISNTKRMCGISENTSKIHPAKK